MALVPHSSPISKSGLLFFNTLFDENAACHIALGQCYSKCFVDGAKLTPEQKMAAMHRFNAETCACGCKLTLAQCRIYDHNCPISGPRTAKIIAEVIHGGAPKPAPVKSPEPPAGSEPPKSPR